MFKIDTAMEWLIFIYVGLSLVIPVASFNKLVFVGLLVLSVFLIKKVSTKLFGTVMIFAIFIYGFFLAFFTNSDMSLARQFLLTTLTLFLIIPIGEFHVDMNKVVTYAGWILLIVDLFLVLYAIGKYDFYSEGVLQEVANWFYNFIPASWYEYIVAYGSSAAGIREIFSGKDIMVHIGSVHFLYLPTCLHFDEFLKNKKSVNLLFVLLALIAVWFSTSRALLLMLVAMLGYLYLRNINNLPFKVIMYSFVALIAVVLLIYLLLNTNVFSMSDGSNSIKVGHINSAIESMTFIKFLFGNGLASHYYSMGVNRMIAHTEITYVDFCRYFGVPLATLIFVKLIFPARGILKKLIDIKSNNYKYLIIFCGYLLMSASNPILFNSIGTIVILWYWSKVLEENELDGGKEVRSYSGI